MAYDIMLRQVKNTENIKCKHHHKRKASYETKDHQFLCDKCYVRLAHKTDSTQNGKPSYHTKHKTCCQRIETLRKKATMSERIFKDKLRVLGYKFKFQAGFIKGNYYAIVDFFIPSIKTVIEVDGGYHFTPEQASKDKYRDSWLTNVRKVKVIRITNQQAETMSIFEVRDLILSVQ